MISRRGFLKGLVLLPAATYVPALLSTEAAAVKPLPKAAERYLGGFIVPYDLANAITKAIAENSAITKTYAVKI